MTSEQPNRLDRWKDDYYFSRIYTGRKVTENEFRRLIRNRREKFNKGERKYQPSKKRGPSLDEFVRVSKEIIFDFDVKEEMNLHFIIYTIDVRSLQICISHLFSSAEPLLAKDVIEVLAIAHAFEIPVLPNNERCEEKLLGLYSELYEHGFTAKYKGKERRLKLTAKAGAPSTGLSDPSFLASVELTRLNPPVFALAARRVAEKQQAEFRLARRFLDEIEAGIGELRNLLGKAAPKESDFQDCLQKNPILFGTEYREIIPKLSLGSEYEMDFALRTWNGEIHMLEIENSTKPLFNSKMRPSAQLIHAEQQILDWYQWIEQFPNYAKERQVSVHRPYAFIIVGRSSDEITSALQSRNRLFRGKFEILTYDDLLLKAQTLKEKVIGATPAAS